MSEEQEIPIKAYLALLTVCIVWGLTWIASKEAVRHMPALQMAGIRQFSAGVLYILFFLYKGKKWPRGKQWLPIALLGFFNFVISNGTSTWALKYISAGLGAIIGASFPIWLIILTSLKYKFKPTALAWTGIGLGFAGICIVFYDHLGDFLNIEFSFGIFLSVVAALSWTVGTIYTKEHSIHFNPYFSIGLQMFGSGIILTLISHSLGWNIPMNQIPLISWLNIGFLVIVSSVTAFIAYIYILQVLPTSLVSIYAYVNPIVAVTVGGIFFDEKLSLIIFMGILTTLAGVYVVNLSLRKRFFFFRPPRNRI